MSAPVGLFADDDDTLTGRELVEFVYGPLADDRDFKLKRKKLYAEAAAGRLAIAKVKGVGLVGRKSTLRQCWRERIDRADSEARSRCGMASPAA